MDWRGVRFDWNRARAFLVSAEEGSFSAAARALAVSQPTVGRQVAALEEELGVSLFVRSGQRLEVTDVGAALLEHCRVMGDAAVAMSLAATGGSAALEGSVCITASELISAFLLPPIVGAIRGEHAGIEIEIVASNAARDLRRREADIAVRNFKPKQPDLIAKKLGPRAARLYATPAYLRTLGDPTEPGQLTKAEFFGFDRGEAMISGLRALGIELTKKNFPVVTENHLVQWEMCKLGQGICIVMEEVGDAEPSVRRVLPDRTPLPVPMWLTTHRELRTSRRIRVVFDRLAEMLSVNG